MPRLYVSYSRADAPFAQQLVEQLQRAFEDEDVWHDPLRTGGPGWWADILRRIKAADVFIYLLSDVTLTTPYCLAEFSEANRLHKPIIPVVTRPNTHIPRDIQPFTLLHMTGGPRDGAAFAQLVGAILRAEKQGRPSSPTPRWPNPTPMPAIPAQQHEREQALETGEYATVGATRIEYEGPDKSGSVRVLQLSIGAGVLLMVLLVALLGVLLSGNAQDDVAGRERTPTVPPSTGEDRGGPVDGGTDARQPIAGEKDPAKSPFDGEGWPLDQPIARADDLAGNIAFISDRDGLYGLYVMRADGSGPRRLVTTDTDSSSPVFSPDGGRIAYHAVVDVQYDVFTIGVDGEERQRLTDHEANDALPAWTAAGDGILFQSNRDADLAELYRMNDKGQNIIRLTANELLDTSPDMSPDGERIAFVRGSFTDANIHVMAADGDDQTPLIDDAAQDWGPRWSPDGSQIAFYALRFGNWDIYVMDSDGENVRRLTTHDAADTAPAWSPDGQHIAFVSDRDGNREIYVMRADGGEVRRLTFDEGDDRAPGWGR